MPHSIFIESTIPSYYVARPSRDLVLSAQQQITKEWWDARRHEFDLFTSQVVLDEASAGEPAKAAERLALLAGIELLDIDDDVISLAAELVRSRIIPTTANPDAFHLATAGIHGVDFLLTWNCKHIANPFIAERIRTCFSSLGSTFQ